MISIKTIHNFKGKVFMTKHQIYIKKTRKKIVKKKKAKRERKRKKVNKSSKMQLPNDLLYTSGIHFWNRIEEENRKM